jgi:hypothetical protein
MDAAEGAIDPVGHDSAQQNSQQGGNMPIMAWEKNCLILGRLHRQ